MAKTALFLGLFCTAATGSHTLAQTLTGLQIGSPNTATAEPPVSRPGTRPVVVPLFHDLAFTDFLPKPFSYAAPGKGPWAKVILTADFSVTAGRQFDRTAQISIGKANVYFGTTQEPSAKAGQTWRAERDVTDYQALLQTAHPGVVDLGNIVNDTYTGVIRGSASLWFYPASAAAPAPETPDVVLPLPTPTGTAASLETTSRSLVGTFTCPRNTVRAYLDVITQSQHEDEFWYTNVPDDLKAKLQQFGGTAFREAEITVDDRPAGVAPVYPWIYTGGIDPSLWRPIPGVQTLNLVPYRVDLTPFAGALSDGQPHRIGLRVYNAANYFLATGTLLLYCDPRATQVTGAVTEDTLTASPAPVVRQDISTDAQGNANGSVSVSSSRQFTIVGYVQTPQGRVETRVAQSVDFSNRQEYLGAGRQSAQNIRQDSALSSVTTTRDAGGVWERRQEFAYPLALATTGFAGRDKAATQTLTMRQGYHYREQTLRNGRLLFSRALTNEVRPSDIESFDATGRFRGHGGQKSAQVYFYDDSRGGHYHRSLTAVGGVLTGVGE